ncbi:hypothetical protein [Sinorhizobium fredii]|uniref:hypothetical protein n=1 Tax=Rhizobium fredii TaxID=380 RepID=UPI001295A52A|nr:hypothetical protein [Sinorhizobium fredii]MQW94068.1 hypothetical protein [Sinorhizobium fredii]
MALDIDTRTVNINTIISIAGFLATFVLLGVAWGTTQATIRDLEQWREGHESAHRDLQGTIRTSNAVFDEQINVLRGQLGKLDQLEYRMALIEKGHDAIDTRINRITESYSNQFADFRTQLSSISTQIALTNQTLQRMEAASPAGR